MGILGVLRVADGVGVGVKVLVGAAVGDGLWVREAVKEGVMASVEVGKKAAGVTPLIFRPLSMHSQPMKTPTRRAIILSRIKPLHLAYDFADILVKPFYRYS